ncbi:MAG: hypothetical protein R3264_19690, partial [Anaerolineae bacterium]|nr:hypothetical protein [Anaerolineae bacterium]
MKRTIIVALALVTALLVGLIPGVAQAQEETLDSRLARAAGKSVLITLGRPELTATRDFYLTDGVNAEGIIGELGEVTGFEVVEADWATDETYAVTATIQPSGRTLTLYSAKYNGRWKVDGLELAAAETGDSVAVTTGTASTGPSPVSGNGSGVLIIQSQSGGDFYRINADGTGLYRISHGIDPQLSPDGTQVAFTRWEPKYELFTINIDGTNERAWTSNWRQMKSPTWSA